MLALMERLALHEFHQQLGARFIELSGAEAVADYGDTAAEHAALVEGAGVLDLSFRSRLCLTGNDRKRFLHGQVTNDINRLGTGQGCYAALTTAKGKMQSDLNVYCLADELLLDFEPGLTATVAQRLEKYLVADDVQVVEVAPHYGLLSVQGAQAELTVRALGLFSDTTANPLNIVKASEANFGELYLANQARTGSRGFDLFVPMPAMESVADKLLTAARALGGRACGWHALETARLEAGIPRFGVDMDESNLPLEAGLGERAVSFNKGCYIGQEVLNRIHTLGHVNKELKGLRLADDLKELPVKGDKLYQLGKEAGYITSAVESPRLKGKIGLGYVRREAGTELTLKSSGGESRVVVVRREA
jgi:folate-binding protein YgfZ